MSKKSKKKQDFTAQAVESTEPLAEVEQKEELVEQTAQLPEVESLPLEEVPELKVEPKKAEVIKPVEKKPEPAKEPTRYDPLEYARTKVKGYNESWAPSISAYLHQMGAAKLLTEEECKSFLTRWGVRF